MLSRVADLPAGDPGRRRPPPRSSRQGAKPGQDTRVDLPAIGPRTLREAARAGLAGIVGEAGRLIIVDRDATTALADELGLFFWAWRPRRLEQVLRHARRDRSFGRPHWGRTRLRPARETGPGGIRLVGVGAERMAAEGSSARSLSPISRSSACSMACRRCRGSIAAWARRWSSRGASGPTPPSSSIPGDSAFAWPSRLRRLRPGPALIKYVLPQVWASRPWRARARRGSLTTFWRSTASMRPFMLEKAAP